VERHEGEVAGVISANKHNLTELSPPFQQAEQFVDHLAMRCSDRSSGGGRRMRGEDRPCAWSCRGQKQTRAIKKGAAGSSFGMRGLLAR